MRKKDLDRRVAEAMIAELLNLSANWKEIGRVNSQRMLSIGFKGEPGNCEVAFELSRAFLFLAADIMKKNGLENPDSLALED